LEDNPRYVFSFTPQSLPGATSHELDVTAHLSDGSLVLELEATARSQEKASDIFGLVKGAITRLQATQSLRSFCQAITQEVAELTGLERVMVYRFAEDDSGWVFAETKREGLESFLDLHYPAEDVPKPAREIYKKIWLRPLPDAQAEPVELVPLVNPDTGKPLDMTYCYLRGASKMYTDYLKNMGVRMSFTMAMHHDGRLWGLIAGHHDEPKVVPHPIRAACEILAQVVSLQLRSAQERDDTEYGAEIQKRLDCIQSAKLPEPVSVAQFFYETPCLLDYLHAGGSAIRYLGPWKIQGNAPSPAQLDALAVWLEGQPATADLLFHTQGLSSVYPPAAEMQHVAAGLLAVPLDRDRQNWLMWFRPEMERTVSWAGDPNAKCIVEGPHGPRLMPRSSFAIWKETVRGRSQPWLPVELQAVKRLRVPMLEVIQQHADRLVSLEQRIAERTAALQATNKELEAFCYSVAHDLRSPLRGLSGFAHVLLEDYSDKLDEKGKHYLNRICIGSERMGQLIDDLLDLSRVSRCELTRELVDLTKMANELGDELRAANPQRKVELVVTEGLTALTDPRLLRIVLTNLLGNAWKFTSKQPHARIQFGCSQENGVKEYFVRDNGAGFDQAHTGKLFGAFQRLHATSDFEGTGIGLATVRRIIERQGGEVRAQGKVNQGATFHFTL
jgi:light-regulated signal transduction histidine kinase (bacteriophytochrome)